MMKSIAAALVVLALTATATATSAVSATTDLSTLSPEAVVQSLAGPGVEVSNVSFTGELVQAGTFLADEAIGFDSGVVLGSGPISVAVGPNSSSASGVDTLGPGDADLTELSGFPTFNAAVLEFDFVADAETVFFRYIFASEEYNEYVNTQFNDVFAFYVNGVNCAVIEADGILQPITVNTINNGNPAGDTTATNPALFRDNTIEIGAPFPTEMDGLTVPLLCMAGVEPAPAVNRMKLAIADASDGVLDSLVLLEQGSLSTTPPSDVAKATGGGRVDVEGGFVTFGGVVIEDEQGLRGNLRIHDHRTGDNMRSTDVDEFAVDLENRSATWSGPALWNGEPGYRFEATIVDQGSRRGRLGTGDLVEFRVSTEQDQTVWTLTVSELRRGNVTLHD